MKDINLFDGIKKSAPPKKSGKSAAPGVALLIVCAVAVGGLYFWMTNQKDAIQSQIESANQQIGTSQSVSSGDMQTKQAKLAAIRSYNAMLTALDENIKAYPVLDAAFLSDLEGRMPTGVTVKALGYQNGVLTLDCTAGSADAAANFANALAESEDIESVNLKRSQLDTQAELEAGVVQYEFTVVCYLKGGGAQ